MNPREQVFADADKEMFANRDQQMILEMDLQSIMSVVGLVQLACRHPGVSWPIRARAVNIVVSIGSQLQEAGLHGLAAMVRAGWNSEFDEEISSDQTN